MTLTFTCCGITFLSITLSWCVISSFDRFYFLSFDIFSFVLIFGIFTAIGLLSKSFFFFLASYFSNSSFFFEVLLLGSSLFGQGSKTDFLVLSEFVLSFFFFIPVLDVM